MKGFIPSLEVSAVCICSTDQSFEQEKTRSTTLFQACSILSFLLSLPFGSLPHESDHYSHQS